MMGARFVCLGRVMTSDDMLAVMQNQTLMRCSVLLHGAPRHHQRSGSSAAHALMRLHVNVAAALCLPRCIQ
jgi:hypothetical protein